MDISKKVICFMIVMSFCITFVSAFGETADFNATDGEYGSYDIESGWGFLPVWLGGGDKAWIRLNENTDHCLIDCKATLEGEFFEPRSLVDGIEFINKQGDYETNLKDLNFRIGQYENITYEDPIYEEVCEEVLGNETNSTTTQCYQNQKGTTERIEEELVWKTYEGEEVEGYFQMEILAKKDPHSSVDWIIEVFGEKLTSWAWWDSDWTYKREITLNSNIGNFSYMNISYYSNMNSDFSDVRFLNNAEDTEFNYTIESKLDGGWAVFRINNKGEDVFYMYYGNALATTTSSALQTYITPVGGYYLDNNAYDFLGNKNGTVVDASPVEGYLDYAYNFTGEVNTEWDYINLGTNYNYDGTDNFSFSVWINPNEPSSSHPMVIISRDDATASLQYNLNVYSTSGVRFAVGNTNYAISGSELLWDTWYHVVAVVDSGTIYLYLNGTLVDTEGSIGTATNSLNTWIGCRDQVGSTRPSYNGIIDELYVYDYALSSTQVKELYTQTAPTFTIGDEQQDKGFISLDYVTPPTLANGTNWSETYIPVEISVNYTNATLENITYNFYKGGVLNQSLFFTNETYFVNATSCLCDNWAFNVTVCYFESIESTYGCSSTETRFITIDVRPPEINVTSPNGTYPYIDNQTELDLNWSVSDNLIGLDSCWFEYDGEITFLTCGDNHTTFNYSTGTNNLTFFANDTLGNEANETIYWNVVVDQYTQGADYSIVGEGTDVTFNLTIDYSISHTGIARLHINGNTYAPDNIVTISGQNFYEKTVNMPDGYGNATGNYLDWYWTYNITDYSTAFNTSTQTLVVYAVEIDDCSSYGDLILNMTLKDEALGSLLPGVNESSQVEIDLEISGVDNYSIMWDYSNTYYNESNPQVCIPNNILNFSTYRIDFTIGYSSTDHVQEFYYLDNGTLDNSKEFNSYTDYNIDLYDLLTDDSTTFLFNFFDTDGLPVDNAIIHTFRRYIGDGVFLEVERSKQDNNGETHMHLVEEDVIYYFMITQNGVIIYISDQYNALCETLPCTITLTETGEFEAIPTDYSLIDGDSYIVDNATTRTSTYVYAMGSPSTIEYVLYKQEFNGTVTEIDSASSTSSAGTLSVDIPLHSGNVSYFTAIYKEGEFVSSQWVDLDDMDSSNFFGSFLAVFLGFLIILALVLMSVTEKTGTIVAFTLGLIFTGALGLTKLTTSTGQSLVIYVVIAGGIIIFKLAKKRS